MKFRIKDENGDMYTVEKEVKEVKTEDFTDDEKALIKKLLEHADELLNLLEVEKDEHDTDFSEEELDLEEDDVEEEVIGEAIEDSEAIAKVHDSKASFGSIERAVPAIDKELEMQDEIVAAWTKRYGG